MNDSKIDQMCKIAEKRGFHLRYQLSLATQEDAKANMIQDFIKNNKIKMKPTASNPNKIANTKIAPFPHG